jgi:aldose 1-epimerase
MFAFRGSLLAPWPNRVAGGRWSWEGRDLELPVNDPAAGAALHGLVFDVEWSVTRVDATSIALAYALPVQPGYPFPLQLDATYALTPDGLACSLTALNSGAQPAPVGLGVHPYVAAPGLVDDLVVRIPAEQVLKTDDAWREVGRPPVQEAGVDFRSARRLGELQLDAGFTDVARDAEGRTQVTVGLPDGRQVVLWAGRTCRWWLIYTGHTLPPADFRRSLAVEPMTCPPNALSTGEIDVLAPGESLRLDWGLTVH